MLIDTIYQLVQVARESVQIDMFIDGQSNPPVLPDGAVVSRRGERKKERKKEIKKERVRQDAPSIQKGGKSIVDEGGRRIKEGRRRIVERGGRRFEEGASVIVRIRVLVQLERAGQRIALVWCIVLQCVAMRCNVLQCVVAVL